MDSKSKSQQKGNIYRTIRDAALKRIVNSGSFLIPEISSETGISVTTVAKYVNDMVENGIVEVLDKQNSGKRGRRPVIYGIRSGNKFFLAIDVKNSGIIFGLMDLSGKMVATDETAYNYENSIDKLHEIKEKLDLFLVKAGQINKSDIVGACVCLGGRVNSKAGTSASGFNLEALSGATLAQYFTELFGIRTCIENDTKAMTYGEYNTLPYRNIKDALFINIGWGIGLGIVINGEIYNGKDGYSGEFGHAPIYDNNIICHCGKKGCLETEVSGRAIHRKLIERIKSGEASRLSSKCLRGDKISLSDIMEAAQHEDPLCIDLITKTGYELGKQLSTVINIFNPECIILGGEISAAAAYYFLQPVQANVRNYSIKLMSQDLPIVTSSLGVKAGIYGGCLIAKRKFFLDECF